MTFPFVPSSFVKFSNFCADPLFVAEGFRTVGAGITAGASIRRNLSSNQICIGALIGDQFAGELMVNHFLFRMADFLSRPPGFYFVIAAMIVSTALVPFGLTSVITYALSVAAIVITSVVLIQGYRDTAAIHAKLDEIIVSLRETRNEVVGLEHEQPEHIAAAVERLEEEANQQDTAGRDIAGMPHGGGR